MDACEKEVMEMQKDVGGWIRAEQEEGLLGSKSLIVH